jgi:DNA-binding MarR family transcriptional regulator
MDDIKKQLTEQITKMDAMLFRYRMQGYANDGPYANPHRGQGRVLAILKLQPEIEQRELGYLLDMSKQALSGLIGKLEKTGYITRTQSEKDHRSYIIKLTDAGRAAAPDVGVKQDNNDFGAFLDCLDEEEQRNLSEYLGRLIKSMEEQFGIEENEYAEFYRERFFARHEGGGRGMHDFDRKFGGRGGPQNHGDFRGPKGYDDDRF